MTRSFLFQAIFWKVLGCFCFAGINVILKKLDLPSTQIICLENLLAALFLSPIFLKHAFPKSLLKKPTFWLRPILGVAAVLIWIHVVKTSPILGQSVTIGLLVPFLCLFAAWIFLREPLSLANVGALFLATIGGILVVYGPVFSCLGPVHYGFLFLCALLAKIAFSGIDLLTKHLIHHTHPLILSFGLVLPMGLGLLPTYASWEPINATQAGMVLLLGALVALAHLSLHVAYKKTNYTLLLPLGPIRAIATNLLGFYILNERLPSWLLRGSALIFCASIWLYTSQAHRAKSPP